jgi:hypothetical protein
MRACIEISGHRQSPGDDCRMKRVSDELSSFVEAWCPSLSLAAHAVSSTNRKPSTLKTRRAHVRVITNRVETGLIFKPRMTTTTGHTTRANQTMMLSA